MQAGSSKTREAPAQYIARPPVSRKDLLVDEEGTDTVIYRAPAAPLARQVVGGSRFEGTARARACAPRGWSRQPHLVCLAPEGWKRDHQPQPSVPVGPLQEHKPKLSVSARQSRAAWARLRKKVYKKGPLICCRCRSPMKLIAVINDPAQVLEILLLLVQTGWPPPAWIPPASADRPAASPRG